MRRLLMIAAVTLAVPTMAGPASAKGPAITLEVPTDHPVVGAPVTVELREWEWRPDGTADTTKPWPFPEWFDGDRLHLDLELRTGDWNRGTDDWRGEPIPVPAFHRVAPTVYRAIVRLPAAGMWRLAWANDDLAMGMAESEEGLPTFRVYPKDEPAAAAGPGPGLAGLGLLIAGAAVRERRRSREEAR